MNQAGLFILRAALHQALEEIYPSIFSQMREQSPDLVTHLSEGFGGRHGINQLVKSFAAHQIISEI
jgi:hypothetical protein